MKFFSGSTCTNALVVLVLLCSILGVSPAYAVCSAAITVTNNGDSGAGSLRQAIADLCDGGTITFNNDYSISLTTGQLSIDKSLTIDGTGHSVAVSGNFVTRVFNVTAGTVVFNALTISNGSVQTTDCGSFNAQCGGGLMMQNNPAIVVTVFYSTFSLNSAPNGNGGGIYQQNGTLNVINSTFSSNTSSIGGGGIYSDSGTSLNVTNSTFSSNSAPNGNGGGISTYSTLQVTNSTFSGNNATTGGGIYNFGTATLKNTLMIKGTTGANCFGTIGGATNMADDASCGAGFTNSATINPGTLGFYAGHNQTIPLLPGSAAIDAGDDTVCAAAPVYGYDQRGVIRPWGAHCDIGAFEAYEPLGVSTFSVTSPSASLNIPITAFTANSSIPDATGYLVTTSSSVPAWNAAGWVGTAPTSFNAGSTGTYTLYPWVRDAYGHVSPVYASPVPVTVCFNTVTVINNANSGAGSLRQAIGDLCPGGTITFNGDTTITLTSELVIGKDLTIDGGAHRVIVSGNHVTRVFNVTAGWPYFNALTIANGSAQTTDCGSFNTSCGGGIMVQNDDAITVQINHSTFTGNSAGFGGGIYALGAVLSVNNSTFSGNDAGNGGGIFSYGTLSVRNSTFFGNTATTGGGIDHESGAADLRNTLMIKGATGDNCFGIIGGYSNMADDVSCGGNFTTSATINPGTLGYYGGSTQTIPLLAGSAAIDAGDDPICTAAPISSLDQRGVTRPQGVHCDIGAFEAAPLGVSTFSATSPSNSLNIPITAFTAKLSVPAASAYLVTTSSSVPASNAAGWAGTAPTTFNVGSTGLHTLYPWVKDASGNVSAVYASPVDVTVCFSSAISVTNSANSGAGSLRQAITDICPGGTITFFADATITLASELAIDKSLTIDGEAHSITVSGGDMTRVFNVTAGTVFFNALTIANGSVQTDDCGSFELQCGGGLMLQDNPTVVVTVTNSTFTGNSAEYGGGIGQANGTLHVTGTTFSGNSASSDGGGIYGATTLNVTNSTFSENSADIGGGIRNDGNMNVTNSTFSGNNANTGGGIFNNNTATLKNTLMINGAADANCAGSGTFGGATNMADDDSCGAGFTNSASILAGTLGHYGGGTQTIPLLAGSAAIDAGDDTVCAAAPVNNTSQNGVTRPQGSACDIGAFEAIPELVFKNGFE